MRFENLMGLIIFSGSLLLMFLTVPWREIKKFALFGLVSGFGVGIALIIIMQNWLGLWIYHNVDFIYLGTIPLILSAAWTPTEILFAHFLDRYQHTLLRIILTLFIPGIAVVIHYLQIWNNMLTYHHWNLLATYMVSLGIHSGLALYLNRAYKNPMLS